MKALYAALVLVLVLSAGAYAHSGDSGITIDLSPQAAFQGDEIALEAGVESNGSPAGSLSVSFTISDPAGFSERLEAKERTLGSYFVKYAFKNAGSHEILVDASGNGLEASQAFSINVEGRSLQAESYFLAAPIFFLALSALYAMRTRKIKSAAVMALVLLVAAGLAYSVYVVYSSGAAQRGVFVCVSEAECYWSAHIHAEVSVEVCGEAYRFHVEKGRLDGPHTHEEKNLIHFHERLPVDPATKEILDATPLTLGAFFDAMEVDFGEDSLLGSKNGGMCKGQPGSVKMFVNGRPSRDFREYVWKDGDKIELIFDERPAEAVEKGAQAATSSAAPEITLPIIIGFALIDSINPCVIGVLLLLITVLLKTKKRRAVLVKGSVYTLGVYATYMVGGITLLSVFNAVREIQLIGQSFYVLIGAFILLAAFLEIKDYFWYGRWFSLAIPKRFVKTVESSARGSHASLAGAFLFGAIVTLIELPCTGAPYLAIITMMSQSGVQFYSALLFLLLYNLVFVVPLIVIIYLAYRGVKYKKMESWRREHKGRMRLAVGLMLLGIGAWIVTAVLDWLLPYLVAGIVIAVVLMYALKRADSRRRSHG